MDKVSVIVPMYNAEEFISDTLDSIIDQTYTNLEIICVDDISTDRTQEIVLRYIKEDSRIKYYQLQEKGGASIARNLGIQKATGRYIAFLDADDVWLNQKLEKQLDFMKKNKFSFTYTYFGFIDKHGVIGETYRISPKTITYKSLLYGNTIGCLTVIYDSYKTGLIQIDKIDKRNDYALWLKILKIVDKGVLFPEILSNYRYTETSLSNKDGKLNLLKYHYQLHRNLEGFSLLKTAYYTVFNIINTFTIKNRYIKRR